MKLEDIIERIYSLGSSPDLISQCLLKISDIDHIKKIIDEFNFDVRHNDDELIIHFVRQGKSKIVHLLLDYGANPRANGDKLLVYACRFCEYSVAERLLDMGVPINIRADEVLDNILYVANSQLLKIVLDHGINISKQQLVSASYKGEPEMLKMLIDHGADPSVFNKFFEEDEKDFNEEKPISKHDEKYIEVANMLLSHGVAPETTFKYLLSWFRMY